MPAPQADEPPLAVNDSHRTDPIEDAPGQHLPAHRQSNEFEHRYRSEAELARGGMGRVLLAHDSLLDREVALKELLRKDSPGAAQRFEREARLTARLQHPGIVSVYELARRASGEPVMVMRRVQGQPLDAAIVAAGTLASRLNLLAPFIAACDAVAYAHRQGVIHRDLKPANVLLGDFGDTVVIDWGLAKELTAGDSIDPKKEGVTSDQAQLALTLQGAVVGTPHYMSPEQARGEVTSTRSDVYTLGAMLYQLLSAQLPYAGKSTPEVLELVKTAQPQPLATRVPGLPRDLITVVERAMSRQPRDRFADAGELSAELKRFQTGTLLVSHTYSTRELVTRWARRRAPLLVASAIFLLVLTVGSALGLRRILAERDRANERSAAAVREAKKSKAVSEFLQTMLSAPSPITGTRDTKVLDVLDGAAERIGNSFASEPETEAALRHTLGVTYLDLTELSKSEKQLEAALKIRMELLGPDHPDTLASRAQLFLLHLFQARWELAAGEGKTIWEARKRVLGPDDPDTLSTLADYASALTQLGKHDEGAARFQELLAARTRLFGPEDKRTLLAMALLGVTMHNAGKLTESERTLSQAFALQSRVLGPDAFDTLYTESELANVYAGEGKLAEAEPLLRRVLAVQQRTSGPTQYNTLYTEFELLRLLCKSGQTAEAETMANDLEPKVLKTLSPSHALAKDLGNLRAHCIPAPAK